VDVEHAASGEEAPDPAGLEVGYDVHQHEAGHPRPHRRIAKGGDGGEPAQRGADHHTSRWLGAEHGGDVVCAGRERRKIRAGLEVLGSWLDHGADLGDLVDALAVFCCRGYGELAVALHAAGWRDEGSGMLDPVVDALHALRPDATDIPVEDTRLAVAALHQALATEPVYGPAFRRSAGLTGPAATAPGPQLRWWTTHLARCLGLR
jgi:hypothetical protein